MQTMTTPGLHKYLRRPATPPTFWLQERDIEIVRFVARVRFATTDQIHRYLGGSRQVVLKRTKLLFWHEYLDKPPSQHREIASRAINPPHVFALGKKGAKLLAGLNVTGVNDRLDWHTKNARVGAQFVAHTIGLTDFLIALAIASRAPEGPRLLDHFDLLPFFPALTRESPDPFTLHVNVRYNGRAPCSVAIRPDRLCSLVFPDETRLNFAIEYDTGSMPVASKANRRRRPEDRRTTYEDKLAAYAAAWQSRDHTDTWGFKSFRVLTITQSEERIAHMIEAQRALNILNGFFLYTTPERIEQHGTLGPAWISVSSNAVSLLE